MSKQYSDVRLEDDQRWRRLHDASWTCPCCGQAHNGVFDLAYDKPDFWQGSDEKNSNDAALTSTNFLSEDFCALDGQHFFVRCVLQLPILGSEGVHFGFGVWSTLSADNFKRYVDTFDAGEQSSLGPWFGWLSNRLNGYPDTLNLKCQLHLQDGRQRPYIELEPTDHPLARDQRDGIAFDRVLEIYAANDHDMRTALCD